MDKVDRAHSFAPVLVFGLDAVAQISCRYLDPFRDDVEDLQVFE